MASSASMKRFILAELRNRGVSATKDGMSSLLDIATNTPQDRLQNELEELLDAAMKEDCECEPTFSRFACRSLLPDPALLVAVATLSGGVINSEIIQRVSQVMEGEDSGDPGRPTAPPDPGSDNPDPHPSTPVCAATR